MVLPVEWLIVAAATLIFLGSVRLYASHRRAEMESKQAITLPPKRPNRPLRNRRLRTDPRAVIALDSASRRNRGRRGPDHGEG